MTRFHSWKRTFLMDINVKKVRLLQVLLTRSTFSWVKFFDLSGSNVFWDLRLLICLRYFIFICVYCNKSDHIFSIFFEIFCLQIICCPERWSLNSWDGNDYQITWTAAEHCLWNCPKNLTSLSTHPNRITLEWRKDLFLLFAFKIYKWSVENHCSIIHWFFENIHPLLKLTCVH